MKKILSMILALCLLCALAAPALAEEPLAGGWTANAENPTVIPDDVKAAFDKAMETLAGVGYEPVAYLGSQLVAGMNYCLLCTATVVAPDAVPTYALVYIYADLEGNATVSRVEDIVFDAVGSEE